MRKALAHGVEQKPARFERKGEGAATGFDPLDALLFGRARLDDPAHISRGDRG
jgi:hypothetical protein